MTEFPAFEPPNLSGLPEDITKYLQGNNAAHAEWQQNLQAWALTMIDAKHATLLIPRTTIDPASAAFTIVGAGWAGLQLQNVGTTGSAAFATIKSYTGRGVIQKIVVAEKDSGGALANNIGLQVTIDGLVAYTAANFLTTQMTMRSLIGGVAYVSTSVVHVLDDSIGLPFNASFKIEAKTAAGTASVGYKVAYKL